MNWLATVDPASGGTYFFNASTGEVSWELPPGVNPASVCYAVTNEPAAATSIQTLSGASSTPAKKPAAKSIMEGWVTKSDKHGKHWKRRWVVISAKSKTLSWFNDNPEYSLNVYKVVEKSKGSFSLLGVDAQIVPLMDAEALGCPDSFVLKVTAFGRDQLLGFADRDVSEEWRDFITTISKGGDPTDSKGGVAVHSLVPRSAEPETTIGYMLKAAPGWRTWDRRCFVLDDTSLEFRYYEAGPTPEAISVALGASHPAAGSVYAAQGLGIIKGNAARMLAKTLKAPKGTVSLIGSSLGLDGFGEKEGGGALTDLPAFTVTVNNGRVYRLVAESDDDLQEWVDMFAAVIQAGDKEREVAASSPAADASAGAGSRKGRATIVTASSRALAIKLDVDPELIALAKELIFGKTDIKSGWLHKCDPRGGNWKRRFFVLRGSVLSYYTDDTRAELKGSISISGHHYACTGPMPDAVVGIAKKLTPTYPTGYQIYFGPPPVSDATAAQATTFFTSLAKTFKDAMRPYLMCSESADGAKAWVQSISEVVDAQRTLSGMTPRLSPTPPAPR